MDTQNLIKATNSTKKLIQDENYYKYIFKKTEKIVSVIFYIVQSVNEKDRYERQIADIEDATRQLHDTVLQSLNVRAHVAEDSVQAVTHAIVTVESKLRVAQALGVIAPEVLHVIDNEIDSVLRALAKYSHEDELLAERTTSVVAAPTARKTTPRPVTSAPAKPLTTTSTTTADTSARRARILTIIEAKEEVTIKDITDIISDVSEKTIQRELNAMIEDNQIKRIGERRWSKYKLF